jgi:hypothetical protein
MAGAGAETGLEYVLVALGIYVKGTAQVNYAGSDRPGQGTTRTERGLRTAVTGACHVCRVGTTNTAQDAALVIVVVVVVVVDVGLNVDLARVRSRRLISTWHGSVEPHRLRSATSTWLS